MIGSASVAPETVLTDVPDPTVRTWISEGLATSNRRCVGDPRVRHLSVLVRDPGTGELLGGLWGRTAWDWLMIELLYVAPVWRGAGWARQLVRAAEEEAVRRHCCAAWLYSHDFQAAGFFQHLGYTAFGTLPDYPAGHQRVFLQKSLIEVS
jgi:GNAT superfamily N-acetyltransferase